MSGQQQFHNSISSTLATTATVGATAIQLSGPDFPVVTAPDFYMATLEPVGGGAVEIIKVVAVSGSILTVERAQENSNGAEYLAGSIIQVRNTAGSMARLGQKSDVGAPFPFQTTVVTSALTFYIDPAGDDATGDGTLATPWASLYKALEEAQYLRFGTTGSLTIQCADGTYPMSAQVLLDHPQGGKIVITGTPGTFTFPTGINTGDYSADREAPVVPIREPNDLYNTAGSCPYSTNASARVPLRASDSANNRSLLKSQAGVIFDWAAAGADESKIVVETKARITYANFSFPVSAAGSRIGFAVQPNANLNLTNVTTNGGRIGVFGIAESSLELYNVAITGASDAGVDLRMGSTATCGSNNDLLVQGCTNVGLAIEDCASLVTGAGSVQVSGGLLGAYAYRNSTFTCRSEAGQTWVFSGNYTYGVQVFGNSTLSLPAGTLHAEGNAGIGVECTQDSHISTGLIISRGNLTGVSCTLNATVRLTGANTILQNNATYGAFLTDGSLFACSQAASVRDNDGDAISVADNASFSMDSTAALTVTGNTGRVFNAQDAGNCNLGALVCDLTNVASPHLQAVGRTFTRSVAPGSGGVDAGIVYSPAFGGSGLPDLSYFEAQI